LATLHDYSSDKIYWFTHRTERGPGANCQRTSGGAEGDMLRTILKAKGFEMTQIVMDHDASSGNIACSVFLRSQLHTVAITLPKVYTVI